MDLYHSTFGLPTDLVRLPVGAFPLKYSQHALHAAADDFIGPLQLPSWIVTSTARAVEVGLENGVVVHVLYRISYYEDPAFDLCLACTPVKGKMLVKTVWSQNVDDNHATLKPGRYVNAPA